MSIISGVIAAVAISLTFMYTTFATKLEVDRQRHWLERELNLIHSKLDLILNRNGPH